MVGAAGLEPATPCLEGRCSIHLSYAPTALVSKRYVSFFGLTVIVGKFVGTPTEDCRDTAPAQCTKTVEAMPCLFAHHIKHGAWPSRGRSGDDAFKDLMNAAIAIAEGGEDVVAKYGRLIAVSCGASGAQSRAHSTAEGDHAAQTMKLPIPAESRNYLHLIQRQTRLGLP